MKNLFILFFVMVAIISSLNLASPNPIVIANVDDYHICRYDVDPVNAVASHFFDYPLTMRTVQKYAVTGTGEKSLIVSGYTWFGIEIARAEYTCKKIKTIKSL